MALITYASFCSIFAVFGVLFLAIVGLLFEKQPFYIKGPNDKAAAAKSCYQAAGIYFIVWVISVIYWKYDSARKGQVMEDSNSIRNSDEYSTRNHIEINSYGGGRPYGSIATSE